MCSPLIADLHDEKGRVTLPGFYNGVAELPEDVAEHWRELPFRESDFLGEVGLSVPAGEQGTGRRQLAQILHSRFGLTGAETGLAAEILKGDGRAAAARYFGRHGPRATLQHF